MSVLTPESAVRPTQSGPPSLVGYLVFGPEGWIGTVVESYKGNCLLVRSGLFRLRFLPVLPADVDRVSEIRKTVTLQREPREFVAARLVDGR
jgi:hypothetical protein